MDKQKMKLIDVEVSELIVQLALQAEIEGEEYEMAKSIRLSKWDEEEKKLVEDEAAHAKGMKVVESVFNITDIADFAGLIGNEYEFFLSDEGSIFFEEPDWYEERKIADALWAKVAKPSDTLEGKAGKGELKHVTISTNGIILFVEITGKNGKGLMTTCNYRFGSYTADGEFKRQYKKKKTMETKVKNLFNISDVNDLTTLVGQTVLVKFEKAPNGAMFTSCTGLDE